MGFGETIVQLIENKGLTKTGFAKKLGISRSTLANWENGVTSPDYDELVRASKILGVDISAFQPENKKVQNEEIVNKELDNALPERHISLELWEELKANNAMFKLEIERLWDLVNRLTREPSQAGKPHE